MESFAAGSTLAGRFRLSRPLGRGATGEVWLAEELPAARSVAVKIAADNGWAAELLRRQHEQGQRLVHPGIVRSQEFLPGPPALLVMPYIAGGGIGTLRGSSFRSIIEALIPVAEALDYAHRQGVVHGDLKAANVLRGERGECLLVDFGIGTPGGASLSSMSPQQLDGAVPTVSDDVYGFGSLLFDLLGGQPLFHPDVRPDRIRGEAPVLPVADLGGEPLPASLRRLMGALLQKSPGQRPPGMGAVRAALEDVLRETPGGTRETAVIRPLQRTRDAVMSAAPAPLSNRRPALPARVVWVGLAVVAAVAMAVIFVLPSVVRERGPLVSAVPEPAASSPAPGETAPAVSAASVPQEQFDRVLGEFLQADDELHKINADKWGGADWTELRRLAQVADAAYRERDVPAAFDAYRNAASLARGLLARAPEVLATALRAGEAAIDAGDQAGAIAQFETALAVAPGEERAARGLQRARRLDQVLALMNQGAAAESAGKRADALGFYRQARALDSAWTPASQGISRLEQAAARDAYESQMAQGFSAQAVGDLPAARAAFQAALRARPGDAQARAALEQLDSDQKLARLQALQAEARTLERSERWADALQRYDTALAADANLADARQGQERVRARIELDQQLRRELASADRFNDDAVVARARGVLERARAIADPGPVLRGQLTELDRMLQVAATPVRVTLESDNLTDVTIYKVGRLGAFASRSLELRPGAYTAVGTRAGYRDVRRTFRVTPGGEATPVVVRCEEPI